MNEKQKLLISDSLQGVLLGCLIGWLCYRSVVTSLLGIMIVPFYIKYKRRMREKSRKQMLWHEFKDAAAMLYSSTAAGDTLEKALRDTCCDMKTSDSSYQVLLPEFERICMHLDQNRSLESVLEDFAVRSEDEDIAYFVRVLTVARKSGGSLSSIIRHTADTMNLRMEINSEIETILAGKRGEWRIMLIVPPGILCYMNMCSSEYMNILYTGLTGRLVMTAALMVYAAALWTGHKILDIHV